MVTGYKFGYKSFIHSFIFHSFIVNHHFHVFISHSFVNKTQYCYYTHFGDQLSASLNKTFLSLSLSVTRMCSQGTDGIVDRIGDYARETKTPPQSQGSVERANSDLKDMLIAWMSENETRDWTVGIKFVQFRKNSSYSAGIKQSPYSALFGMEACVGLISSSLPHEVLSKLVRR